MMVRPYLGGIAFATYLGVALVEKSNGSSGSFGVAPENAALFLS
jgi:hypothetical protein